MTVARKMNIPMSQFTEKTIKTIEGSVVNQLETATSENNGQTQPAQNHMPSATPRSDAETVAPVRTSSPGERAPLRKNSTNPFILIALVVLIGFGGWKFLSGGKSSAPSAPVSVPVATDGHQNSQGAQPPTSVNNVNTSNATSYVDPMQYVTKKNQYDREISKLASDVNAYLGSHANFQNENTMLQRAENISRHVYGVKEALRIANIRNTALKNKLMEVFEGLQGRVDGLLDGIRASKNGGDYTPGFRRGGEAYDRFEAANEALNKIL